MRPAETTGVPQVPSLNTLGLYVSVPFCRSKCTFCNFASGVFPESAMPAYVARIIDDLERAQGHAEAAGLVLPQCVDSIYLGGGTPTLLPSELLAKLFEAVRRTFFVEGGAEITMEVAPGSLWDETLGAALACGVNRFSFGVQSFIDEEARAVGRLHTREDALRDLARVAAAGAAASVDLIAGLPGQTASSWRESLDVLVASGVDHASVYMLEVDEESRLGREMLLGGVRYGAAAAPTGDLTAAMYAEACDRLAAADLIQYEISNFSRPGFESRHNLKYWQRRPYLGAGLDASSMLRDTAGRAVRFSTTDVLDAYLRGRETLELDRLSATAEIEEAWFLGLRTNAGVDLQVLTVEFGRSAVEVYAPLVEEFCADGLLWREGDQVALTARGRMISNEVFERFLELEPSPAICPFIEKELYVDQHLVCS